MTEQQARLERLLDDLFTNGQGCRADRLMLVQDRKPDVPLDLGGWARGPVRDLILRHIPELAAEGIDAD